DRAEYHLFAALARAACCEGSDSDSYAKHRQAIASHHLQFQTWAATCPENFADRAALIGAEIARLERRPLQAMDLYERAIRSARANSLVQNEALASELAARFHATRGFDTIAHAYLRDARQAYHRWGAHGKVRQLDERHPWLSTGEPSPVATTTMGTPVEHLDLATVLSVSQAVAGELGPEQLIDTLLRTAMEHGGAARGLLILTRGGGFSIAAEANVVRDTVVVRLRDGAIADSELPESVVRYSARTHESV